MLLPVHTVISNVRGFQLLPIHAHTCYCLFTSCWCEGECHCVLIWIFLMADNVNHLFICLLDICISSLEKCLFKSLKTVFVYSLLSYKSSLYVLDTSFLSESDVQFFPPFCGFICFLNSTICRIFCHICICKSLSSLFNSGYSAKSPFLSELSEQTVFCPAC